MALCSRCKRSAESVELLLTDLIFGDASQHGFNQHFIFGMVFFKNLASDGVGGRRIFKSLVVVGVIVIVFIVVFPFRVGIVIDHDWLNNRLGCVLLIVTECEVDKLDLSTLWLDVALDVQMATKGICTCRSSSISSKAR